MPERTPLYPVLLFLVGEKPSIHHAVNPWQYAKEIIKGYIEVTPLRDGVEILSDEDGIMRNLPFNRLIPSRTPEVNTDFWDFVIKMHPGLADPGQMGVFAIRGDFIMTRTRNGEPAPLTEEDIGKYSKLLGGQPPCPGCGHKPLNSTATYCGGDKCPGRR